MKSEELDHLEKIAKAALPRTWDEHQEWRDDFGYNNGGTPTRFFYIPQHNGNATVEMLAEVSEHIVAFQPKVALELIEAARKAERMASQMAHIEGKEGRWPGTPQELEDHAVMLGWKP
jgi:hypothetical protein